MNDSTSLRLAENLLWIGGAAALAWFFPKTFLAVQGLSAVITLALYQVERRIH